MSTGKCLKKIIMPSVSRFFGIVIYFYFNDHNPPHFHAVYAEYSAEILINDLTVDVGYLPSRALGLVIEWAQTHKLELLEIGKSPRKEEFLNKLHHYFNEKNFIYRPRWHFNK